MTNTMFKKAGKLEPGLGTAVILAAACIAMAMLATSCGGGAGGSAIADTASATGLSVSPPTVTFGNQAVGTTSAAQTNTVTNVGNSTVTISSITLGGTNPSDFAQSNNCGWSLAAGANCTITVIFQPASVGTLIAEVTVTDNVSHNPHQVNINGTGVASAASLSATSLTFASEAVGVTSAAQTITLSNSGNAALNVTSIAVSGANASDFAETNNCGSSVEAGANCTFSVTFKPTAAGTRTAAVTFTDNAPGSPQSVSLSGTGEGASAAASLSPTSVTFASQAVGATSAAQTITLTNSGNAALGVTSIVVSGANASDFAETNNCESSVAAGANCTISVTFKPVAAGTLTAAVSLADTATGSPQSVSLSGTGASASPAANLSPTSLAFGNEGVDMVSTSQVVTLSNTGGASLSISIIAFTGADAGDFTEVNTCSPAVAAGGTCTIAILFTPAASGTRTAALSIADNASGSPQSVALSGSGTHDVMLSWTASTTSGVMGYNVYRGTTSGGESSTPLNSTPISTTTYTDESVTAGTTYYYYVTAVAANGTSQSADSNETDATVP